MDLKDKILKAGIENCLFLVPMRPIQTIMFISYTSSSDPEIIVPATITEDRYKVSEGYKISLKSTYEQFSWQHFYQSDLNQLINEGRIKMFIKVE